MKILMTESGPIGPFNSIEQMEDRWHCDGADYPFSVVGEAHLEDYVSPEPVPEPEPPAPPRHVTKLAFDNRFTQTELVALDLASIDDPTAATMQRELAANLRVYQRKVDRATYIDLDRDDTRAGVMALEQFGILGAGRALVILDAEIFDAERVQ